MAKKHWDVRHFVRQREKYERLAKVRAQETANDPDQLGSPLTLEKYHQMKLEVIAVRREELGKLRSWNIYGDELIRQKEFELDLEQISIGFS